MYLTLSILTLISFLIWISQFTRLIRMKAEDFPSREDKTIWAIAIIFLNLLGAALFFLMVEPPNYETSQSPEGSSKKPLDSYELLKVIFPSYENEINLAMNMKSWERDHLEQRYQKESNESLIRRYQDGLKGVSLQSFGVLLSILHQREIEL